MTNEEARAYFIDCNKRIISVVKDENGYNYETKQIKDVFMRRTFEANELAIKALEHDPQETVTEFADRCKECGARYGRLLNQKWIPVSERLPEENWGVLVYCPTNNNIFCAYIERGEWKIFSPIAREKIKEIVTAWMPLPEPYKEEGSEK